MHIQDYVLIGLTIIWIIITCIPSRKDENILLYLLVSLLTFYNPVTNKLLFLTIIITLIWGLLNKRFSSKIDFYSVSTIIISCLFLYIATNSFDYSKTYIQDQWQTQVLSPIFNGPILGLAVYIILYNKNQLAKILYYYSRLRLYEIIIFGLIIYILNYDLLFTIRDFFEGFIRLDVDETYRLISISTRNANEAAYLLITPIVIIFSRYLSERKKILLFEFILCCMAMILTWSRGPLIISIFAIFVLLLIKSSNKLRVIIYSIISILILSTIYLIFGILRNEDRLLSLETISLRFELYGDYFNAIQLIPNFNGYYENINELSDILKLKYKLSSENFFIDIFVKNGLLFGILVIIYFTYYVTISLILFFKIVKYKINNDYFLEIALIIALLANLLANNMTLFEQTSILWIQIGMIYFLYKSLNKRTLNK